MLPKTFEERPHLVTEASIIGSNPASLEPSHTINLTSQLSQAAAQLDIVLLRPVHPLSAHRRQLVRDISG